MTSRKSRRSSGPSAPAKDQIAARGARMARREVREYREYLSAEQRRQPGCPAREVALGRRGRATNHHCVYVVYLRSPKGDGKAGYYVGMTGLTPEQRFQNHKRGIKAARIVAKCGERLVPRLYAHLNPMPYGKAKDMEAMLAESLRRRGFVVYGGH